MRAEIQAGRLSGTVAAIPSKSFAHRLLICSALADIPTKLRLTKCSDDIEATADCLSAMGAHIEKCGEWFKIQPISLHDFDLRTKRPELDCRESGSTVRFLLPVAAALFENAYFTGSGRLPERPLDELLSAMGAHGVKASSMHLPLTISGKLRGGEYALSGNISSQYLTGLLLALPLIGESSVIKLTTALESASYVDMTLEAMRQFGISVDTGESGVYRIESGQAYRSMGEAAVEGDWSNAAFFLAAGAIGSPVKITGLDPRSAQGDRAILPLLERFGAEVLIEDGGITVKRRPLKGCSIDIRNIPDLLPILSVVASCAKGETTFTGGARLRLKESDRLASTAAMLRELGVSVEELGDGLKIRGLGDEDEQLFSGATVNSSHDHRIVMSAAIAALRAKAAIAVLDAGAVNKSYPAFFEDFSALGGNVDVV